MNDPACELRSSLHGASRSKSGAAPSMATLATQPTRRVSTIGRVGWFVVHIDRGFIQYFSMLLLGGLLLFSDSYHFCFCFALLCLIESRYSFACNIDT